MNHQNTSENELLIMNNLSVDELVELEKKYPYCASIQFQLLQELIHGDATIYDSRSEKAAIYFSDLLKLRWIINVKEQERLCSDSNPANNVQDLKINKSQIQKKSDYSTTEKFSSTNHSEEFHAPYISNTPVGTPSIPEEFETRINEQNSIDNDLVDDLPELPGMNKFSSLKIATDHLNDEGKLVKEDNQGKESTEELLFEPLYTKDYFASLGIKLSDNISSNDKLGNQLKSFTQWLKVMKKIHVEKLNEPDEVVDKKIQTIAEKSNTTEEVVTESMANVLLLQGKHEKAIEMYEKLSLTNPSKSAYFAAIIQVLKKR